MTFDPDAYKTTTRQQWQDYAGGSVLATDLSPAILEHAAHAAAAAGLHNVTTGELDGERLHDLASETLDAAISRIGLVYFPDCKRALTGIHHAIRDGFVGPCELVVAGATR